MLERRYKWKGFNILESHYSNDINNIVKQKKTDILKIYQAGKNTNNALNEFCTLHIDLTQSEDIIFNNFRSNTRNEIRKNLNSDTVEYALQEDLSELDIKKFVANLKDFTHAKGYYIDCEFLISQVLAFQANSLITRATKDNITLAEHLYFYDDNRVRYKSGISYRLSDDINIDPKIIGRSNRGLHWFDMKEFKNRGINIYDFGGISQDINDKNLMNINKFKEGFSKNKVTEYEGNIPISLRGRFALFIKKLTDKIKKR